MRLFIGIDLPVEIKSEIFKSLEPLMLSSKGWESAHDYHQTLLFIGAAEHDKVEEIKKRMDEIHFDPFELKTNGISFFNRRIMYVDFIPSDKLNRLKREIDSRFPEYLRPDEKEFVPHVTVKRWQRYEYEHLSDGILRRALPVFQFEVKALCLFKSERDEHNHKYHVIYQTAFSQK